MVRTARDRFNASFTPARYRAMLNDINTAFNHTPPFRVAESPVFVSKEFLGMMVEAADAVIALVTGSAFMEQSAAAIPENFMVPGEPGHPAFMALDFGVCHDASGEPVPQLIELQGFPSLFGWEPFLAEMYRKHFDVDSGYSHLFGLSADSYRSLLGKVILGPHQPGNVILLDIDPPGQATYIDFLITQKMLGIKPVCITDLRTEGREVYYLDGKRKVPVHRIYNRIIYDELQQRGLTGYVDLTRDLDVEWAGHPNWFFRISKYIMPLLKGKYFPECGFLDQIKLKEGLADYVLKPLFSFSGRGVVFNVTEDEIRKIEEPRNYLVQRKVPYAPLIDDQAEGAKAELRLLYVWENGQSAPRLVANMARLSKGDMVGVKYNKDKSWVGGSVGFYEGA